MLYILIILGVILLYILFIPAPAFSFYRNVYGRRKVLPPDDPELKRPTMEPYMERIKADHLYLMGKEPERVTATAADGVCLCADYYENGGDRTALMIHGYNADPYVNLAAQARWFYEHGYSLLIIYQRGHSVSGGKHCGMGLLEKDDALMWIKYLSSRFPDRKILLYGMSMGGTVVGYISDMVDDPAVRCAIIDCGYISPYGQMKRESKRFHMPFRILIPYIMAFAQGWLGIDIREKTTEHLVNAKLPILFIYGDIDPTVPPEQGMENYEACSSEKQMLMVKGAVHTASYIVDPDAVSDAYIRFTEKYMK